MTMATVTTCLTDTMTRAKVLVDQYEIELTVLEHGQCEMLKAGVHATTLALAAVMGAYNAAAWLRRREQHLAVNALLYAALVALERVHVAHHLALCRRPSTPLPSTPLRAVPSTPLRTSPSEVEGRPCDGQ